jgi:hypothetical protein
MENKSIDLLHLNLCHSSQGPSVSQVEQDRLYEHLRVERAQSVKVYGALARL